MQTAAPVAAVIICLKSRSSPSPKAEIIEVSSDKTEISVAARLIALAADMTGLLCFFEPAMFMIDFVTAVNVYAAMAIVTI